MTQQTPNLAKLVTSLGLSSKQLAAYYFYDQVNIANLGDVNMNMGLPKYVECFTDSTKC